MDAYTGSLVDSAGRIMFRCDTCSEPISRTDILELGLRLPEAGESAGDYLDAELIDSFRHPGCVAAAKAG